MHVCTNMCNSDRFLNFMELQALTLTAYSSPLVPLDMVLTLTGSGLLIVYESVVTLCYSQLMFSTSNFHLSQPLRLFVKTLPHKIIM